MAKLKYQGKILYKGHMDGHFVTLHPNAVFEVSDERAAKLKRDYPKEFADSKEAVTLGDVPKPAAPGAGKTPVANKAATASSQK